MVQQKQQDWGRNMSIRNDKLFGTLLSFNTKIVSDFAEAAKKNPMLYVKSLFCHPLPHRFCELLSNFCIDKELHMIARRKLILEEQRWRITMESKKIHETRMHQTKMMLIITMKYQNGLKMSFRGKHMELEGSYTI